jgi:hypothetical protein
MERDIPERDWKLFSRELRPIALERFCERVLAEIGRVSADDSRTHHDRYLAVYQLVRERDRELAGAFNDCRRSVARMQIGIIRRMGLLTDDEMVRFTPETREWVGRMLSL